MPHSGGGGSHSGGSHSGGHSSGSHGGSGGRSYRGESTSYFNGAKRYTYISSHTGQREYFYSDRPLEKAKWEKIILLVFLLPFYLMPLIFIISAIHIPHPLQQTAQHVYIDDGLGIINENELLPALNSYQEKTGMIPAIVTGKNSDWKMNYYGLETYAYDYYVNSLKTENYVMLIYTTDPERKDFNDWHYELMLGDDTCDILDTQETNNFIEILQKNFTNNSLSFSQAVADSFEQSAETCMKVRVEWPLVIFLVFWYSIVIFITVTSIKSARIKVPGYNGEPIEEAPEIQENNIQKSITVTATKQMLHTCKYCGNTFNVNDNLRCPTCGAQLSVYEIEELKKPKPVSNTTKIY